MIVSYSVRDKKVSFYVAQESMDADTELDGVYIKGSFTAWKKEKDFFLEKKSEKLWCLEVPLEKVSVPGNSGCPEYKFVVITAEGEMELPCPDDTRRTLFTNNVLVLSSSEEENIVEVNKLYGKIKSLSDWDLSKESELDLLSNVRRVPGTKNLFRGYHPYKKSRPTFDTETLRSKHVNEFIEKNKVKSIITLCGNEGIDEFLGETITPYVLNIQREKNQCFIDTSYETVYFDSCGKEYGDTVHKIVTFINSHPAPFYIHCRLGSDRTGTMSATLAALCGASWEEIACDYETTAKMGISEYRNRKLLCYSLSKVVGEDVKKCPNLKERISHSFLSRGILTEEEILSLRNKLC